MLALRREANFHKIAGLILGPIFKLILGPKMGLKRVPNRIFDAEALGMPLGGLLERSWSLLDPKKQSWNRSWSLLEASWSDLRDAKGVYDGSRWVKMECLAEGAGPVLAQF